MRTKSAALALAVALSAEPALCQQTPPVGSPPKTANSSAGTEEPPTVIRLLLPAEKKDQAEQWFNLGSALLGALVGVAIGGFFSFRVQNKASEHARLLAADQRRAHDRALAFALMVKAGRMLSKVILIRQHVQEMRRSANQDNQLDRPMWQRLTPLANHLPEIAFTADEIGVFLAEPGAATANALIEAGDLYLELVHIVNEYGRRRREFGDTFGAMMAGRQGSTTLEGAEAMRAGPMGVELADLANAIVGKADDYCRQVHTATALAASAATALFGNDFPEVQVPPLPELHA